MFAVALKLLFADITKTLGLVFGIAFSVLLMTQQGGFFVSLVSRSANLVQDVAEAEVWVMDPSTKSAQAPKEMRDVEVVRVRGVPGMAWAVALFRATASVKTMDGITDSAQLVGVDDATLVGVPSTFVLGSPEDLRRPDAVAIDIIGHARLWPGEPIRLGRELELNDRRAVVVAVTDARPGFGAPIVLHARFSQAVAYVPTGRNTVSFVVGGVDEGASNSKLDPSLNVITRAV